MSDRQKPFSTMLKIEWETQVHDFTHPLESVKETDWYLIFEVLDPLVAPRKELEELSRGAPNLLVRAWLRGIMDAREKIALVTGIPF